MKLKRILALVLCFAMVLSTMNFSVFADEATSVAKVGNTEYATIDEAIANWTNNTTLTLLADVTLSDVITIKSTEHHILNLGTYTMTAASGKNAFVIQACGTGSAERSAITINADATNPGGIDAGSKCIVYYKYADGGISTEDRPIIKINGGVFTGSTSSYGTAGIYTIGTAARKCATLNITGGTFNCSINGNGKSKLLISGGTFNYSVGSQGDSTCHRTISGGIFNSFGFMTADDNNTKFVIGTAQGNYNVGTYIDDNGYLVVGGPVVTEAGETFEASSANYGGFSSYLKYSSAADEGLYYTSVEEAFADNNKATGEVTVYVDELDMTGISYKGTIVVPEGETITIVVEEGVTPTWTVSASDDSVTYEDASGNELVKNEDGAFVEAGPVWEGEGTEETPYLIKDATDLIAFQKSVNSGKVNDKAYFKLTNDIDLAATSAIRLLSDEATPNWTPIGTFTSPFKGTFDGDGKTILNLVVVGQENQGFIGYANKATIKNINIENATVTGTDCVGAIAGQVYSESRIENCHVSGKIQITGQTNVGGIVGKYYTKVADSSVIGDGTGTSFVKGVYHATDFEGDNVGGIMGHGGENNNFVGNIVKNITVSGTRKIGGIVGTTDRATDVSGCVVENVILETTATVDYAAAKADTMALGGLIGHYYGNSTGGTVVDSTVENISFVKENDVAVHAGAIVGNNRTTPNEAVTGVDFADNTVASVEGATNNYLQPTVTYAAYIGTQGYETIQAAINAAQKDDTVVISAGEYGAIDISNKSITIQGTVGDDGELLTTIKGGNPAITGHSFNGIIKDIKIVDAWKVMYAEPAGNVTVDNVYVTGATYGFHLVAYSPNLTWTIQNSYMDLAWANSFGVDSDGYADIIIRGNTFEATNPYYEGGDVYPVNTYLPSVTVEENIFGENTRISIENVTDTSKINISKNYHADGVENAFDSGSVTVPIKSYYTGVDADGKLTGLVEVTAPTYVAYIGEQGYPTLAEAIAAVQSGETITISCTISEGTIKLPVTLENVTITGGTLKDMTIMASDGNSFSYIGLTFNGITFDNSRLLFTGWRNGEEVIENLTITNCEFKNLNDTTNNAAVHINKDVSEPVNGFTFTNNVIDGATGGNKSGIYTVNTGDVIITGNTFNNIVFRPALVQLADCDGTVDNVVISNNKISNTTRLQVYGTEEGPEEGPWIPSGTDTLAIRINGNIFQNISTTHYICTWGINGTTDIAENYYDESPIGRIYWNNELPTDEAALAEIGVYPIYTELNADGTINTASAYTPAPAPTYVAEVNGIKYETLLGALAEANAGDEIVLLDDVDGSVTLPADVIFNGNGYTISDGLFADGDITFKGITKAADFDANVANTIVNIGPGASLQLTGTERLVVGHGATFNIEGNITDAKTANVADLTPSLVAYGASFTGNGVTFNVKNAYLKFTYMCTSSKSAGGTFDFNIENSIWDQASNKLAFESQSTAATVNFELKDSVLTTASHLVFGVSRGEVVIDNSNVNVGNSKQIENQSTMTVKNGSVVNGVVATSSNAKNPGTLIVDNATYAVTGEFSGSDLGTGTIIVKNGASFTAGSITKANIQIDATGMNAGEVGMITANLSKFVGTIEVINNDKLEAKIVDGKIILSEKKVASVNGVEYATLEEAFKAATSGCTIEILSDVTIDYYWDCRSNGAQFKVPVTIDGNDKTLKFTGEIIDNNWNTVFRFEADATVKNLTIDISEATGVQRAITSKLSITADNVNIIGGGARYGIIFGEGAGTAISDITADITNCEFTDCQAGVSDNANGQDAKSVTITGSKFNNASAVVSAAETATFTGNNMENGRVDIRSYSENNVLDVTATGNTLAEVEGQDNQIIAAKILADEGFLTPVAKINGKYYTTLNKAVNAAQTNDTITLIRNIELNEMVTVPKGANITLDLNGKTITGTDNTEKNFSLIDNRGDLTITGNGKMTLTATVNSGWNRYSAVLANNPGGKLTIENGTFEHLGGTDMAYGIDNLTNGKGTYAETIINGGTIKSTYRGIRQFLNGIEAQNILTVNGGTVEGDNKSIWMQDPSKNANTGTLTVGENASLIGDVYLFVTAGSTEWPVTVSIAVAALKDGSTVVTGNVPEKYDVKAVDGTYGVHAAIAKIGDVKFGTLQAAINSAQDGDTITLLSDIELSSTLDIKKSIILDGNNHKIIPAADFSANGHGAVLVLEDQNSTYTIKNLTFEGFTGLIRVVRANFAKITIDNCDFNNNTVSEGVITSAYADLTVNACEFNNNTANFAVINVGSDVNNGTELVADLTGNTFTGNNAAIAIVYLASSANVTDNCFSGNIHTGDNANAAAILAGPYTGNMSYTINITDNAFVNAISKDGSALPAVFAEDWSSLGSTTAFDLSSNYWDGNKPAEGYATSGENPDVTLDDYYTTYVDGELGGLVEIAAPAVNPFKDAPLFLAGLPDETVDGVIYHPVYIATSIDSLNYQKVGFDYIFSIFNPETDEVTFTAAYTTETNEVYSSISDATTTYTVDSIGGNGEYLFMNKLLFNAEYYHNNNTKITITPYAYDMNGNKITGWTFDMTNEFYKSLQQGDVKQDMFKEGN